MVPEKPPRRSKTDKEPVTIDLTAEASTPVAEPVRSNDTDEPATTAEKIAEISADASEPPKDAAGDKRGEEPVAGHSSADEPNPETAPAEASHAFEPPGPTPDTAEEPKAETVPPEPEPAPHIGSRPDPTAASEPTATVEKRGQPAVATLVAAGIFGGIVALLLAGSMQYAGYLPGGQSAAGGNASGLSSELNELRQEIAALKGQQGGQQGGQLASRVAALESSAKASGGAGDPAVAALKAELDRLRATVQASTGNDAALTQRLSAAEAKLNQRGPEQQVARAVAAAALKAAIDRGGRFDAELQTYAAVAANDPAVADLQKFATTGVPSRADLQRDFPAVANAMLEAAAQPDPNQGLAGRLVSSAFSVVKVRRVGDIKGDAPDAVVARMEEALRNGNLDAAIAEWNALPDPAKAASGDFKAKLEARAKVENLVGATLTRAMAGTSAGNQAGN